VKNPSPLEKDIESKVVKFAKENFGMLVYKFTSPSRRSVPDRLFITNTGDSFFIEFKRLGEKPTAAQQVEIEKLRKQRARVWVVDDVEEGKTTVRMVAHGLL